MGRPETRLRRRRWLQDEHQPVQIVLLLLRGQDVGIFDQSALIGPLQGLAEPVQDTLPLLRGQLRLGGRVIRLGIFSRTQASARASFMDWR